MAAAETGPPAAPQMRRRISNLTVGKARNLAGGRYWSNLLARLAAAAAAAAAADAEEV